MVAFAAADKETTFWAEAEMASEMEMQMQESDEADMAQSREDCLSLVVVEYVMLCYAIHKVT